MVTTISLLEEEEEEEDRVDGQATLMRLDALYAYYHHHWWCRRRQFTHFKRAHIWWNGLALLLMASGLIVGPVLKSSWVVAGLAAVSTLVKGWIEFRNWGTLVQLSRFAYTTYAKTLIELRTWARGGDDGDPAAFLVKMQTLDDIGDGFCATLDRQLSEGLRGPVYLSPSPFYKSDQGLGGANHTSMPTSRRRRHCPKGRQGRRRRQQQGGVIPLLALLAPALAAAGKAAALSALGGAAGYAATTRRRRG